MAWLAAHPLLLAALMLLCVLALVFVHDVTQRKHAILHNYPVVGHLRYLFEDIGPELRQYWVANDKEEQPFNRSERAWVYSSSKGQKNDFGFGTSEVIYGIGYPILKHATFPHEDPHEHDPGHDASYAPCLKVMGATHKRRRPYRPPSVVNISAMSFGSLGQRAITALNQGAKMGGCYHNTGEGGVSPYHKQGADLVWQLGTGYFGARGPDGKFSLDEVAAECERTPQIRAIEIKLSQGAKPGKGGILPGAKVTPEIAAIRKVEVGKTVHSPAKHGEFHDVDSLIDFVERIAGRTGLPVGIKSAVGELHFWEKLAERMRERQQGPDFITIDGGEGGTGAAPLAFSDHVSLPFKVGFARVYPIFQQAGISEEIVWIGSGKLGFPDRAAVAMAMGCDLIHIAREAMMSIGCIQAQKCQTGKCPAGVATHDKWLQAGIDVDLKAERFSRYVRTLRTELNQLAHATGHAHPSQFSGEDIEFSVGVNQFKTLADVLGYAADPVTFTKIEDYPLTP
ncbi:MAG: FMN-binding glutamate synthase family protein [Deltaproteobacteria bacterium]|nr:MAG: FMN-binding glutamate synthase family protein [Deltaproteobacteria bacterium]